MLTANAAADPKPATTAAAPTATTPKRSSLLPATPVGRLALDASFDGFPSPMAMAISPADSQGSQGSSCTSSAAGSAPASPSLMSGKNKAATIGMVTSGVARRRSALAPALRLNAGHGKPTDTAEDKIAGNPFKSPAPMQGRRTQQWATASVARPDTSSTTTSSMDAAIAALSLKSPLRSASRSSLPRRVGDVAAVAAATDAKDSSPAASSWDTSFARKELTPNRLPWSRDIRMRKSPQTTAPSATKSPQNNLQAVDVKPVLVASPRTPHVSQINVKRQKHFSQLSRPMIRQPSFTDETDAHVGATEAKGSAAKAEKTTATSKKREDVVSDDDGFAMPSLPTKAKSFHIKSSVSQASSTFFANSGGTAVGSGFKMPGALPVDTDVLKREVELLRLKLKKEQDMRIQLESKLDRESKAHLQLKMEHQLVVSQLQQARDDLRKLRNGK